MLSYATDLLNNGEGGIGYLLKDRVSDLDTFFAAIDRVAAGGTVMDPEVVAQLVGRGRSAALSRPSPPVSAKCWNPWRRATPMWR